MSAGSFKCCGCGADGMDLPDGSHPDNDFLLCSDCGASGPVACEGEVVEYPGGMLELEHREYLDAQGGAHGGPRECRCGTVQSHAWCPACRTAGKATP